MTNKKMAENGKERPGVDVADGEDLKDGNKWRRLVHSRPTLRGT